MTDTTINVTVVPARALMQRKQAVALWNVASTVAIQQATKYCWGTNGDPVCTHRLPLRFRLAQPTKRPGFVEVTSTSHVVHHKEVRRKAPPLAEQTQTLHRDPAQGVSNFNGKHRTTHIR